MSESAEKISLEPTNSLEELIREALADSGKVSLLFEHILTEDLFVLFAEGREAAASEAEELDCAHFRLQQEEEQTFLVAFSSREQLGAWNNKLSNTGNWFWQRGSEIITASREQEFPILLNPGSTLQVRLGIEDLQQILEFQERPELSDLAELLRFLRSEGYRPILRDNVENPELKAGEKLYDENGFYRFGSVHYLEMDRKLDLPLIKRRFRVLPPLRISDEGQKIVDEGTHREIHSKNGPPRLPKIPEKISPTESPKAAEPETPAAEPAPPPPPRSPPKPIEVAERPPRFRRTQTAVAQVAQSRPFQATVGSVLLILFGIFGIPLIGFYLQTEEAKQAIRAIAAVEDAESELAETPAREALTSGPQNVPDALAKTLTAYRHAVSREEGLTLSTLLAAAEFFREVSDKARFALEPDSATSIGDWFNFSGVPEDQLQTEARARREVIHARREAAWTLREMLRFRNELVGERLARTEAPDILLEKWIERRPLEGPRFRAAIHWIEAEYFSLKAAGIAMAALEESPAGWWADPVSDELRFSDPILEEAVRAPLAAIDAFNPMRQIAAVTFYEEQLEDSPPSGNRESPPSDPAATETGQMDTGGPGH